jgi:hypothetical protein
MRKHILAVLLTALAAPVAADDWEISRTYRSSTDHIRVIIKTTRSITVQCAAQDSSGDPIVVSSTQYIDPPMDEVLIRDFGKTKSVRCWKR